MHQVRPVEDDQLPESSPWAFATVSGETYLFIRRSQFACPEGLCVLLGVAWEAWREVGGPILPSALLAAV